MLLPKAFTQDDYICNSKEGLQMYLSSSEIFWVFFVIGLKKNFFFFLLELIYNAVPILAVQQSDSVIDIETFFFLYSSIMVYHRIWTFLALK